MVPSGACVPPRDYVLQGACTLIEVVNSVSSVVHGDLLVQVHSA